MGHVRPVKALFLAALGVVVDGAVERRVAIVDLVDLLDHGQVHGQEEERGHDDDQDLLGPRQRRVPAVTKSNVADQKSWKYLPIDRMKQASTKGSISDSHIGTASKGRT